MKKNKLECEYVRDHYGVPAQIGLRVCYKNRNGTIYKDGGNYISVNFDDLKAGECENIHPTDPSLEYKEYSSKLRKLTRSQLRYQNYLNADVGYSFAEWLGVKNGS